jgi:hypothetical protein
MDAKYDMCFVDAALIFYPIAVGCLVFTGVRLFRKYKETKNKPNEAPSSGNSEQVLS